VFWLGFACGVLAAWVLIGMAFTAWLIRDLMHW
jgi:hypothetical protein